LRNTLASLDPDRGSLAEAQRSSGAKRSANPLPGRRSSGNGHTGHAFPLEERGLIRYSLKYVPRRQYDQVTKDLKPIYTAGDVDSALEALERFEQRWGKQLPPVIKAWRDNWEYVIPFMAFPPDVRRVVYTTNPIEALNRQLRKAIKTKGHFPNEEAAQKLIYLAIVNATRSGPRPPAGRKPSWRSRSSSETDYPTNRLHRKSDTLLRDRRKDRVA
jgi:hypothetical protein